MPLDPQVRVLLDMMKGMPSFSELSPAAARKQTSEMRAMRNAAPAPVANVEDRKIPGPAGSIPVRIYTPAGSGPFPVLVYYHGGGFVIGDLESHDGVCRQLTNGAGCVTVAVDYRLAPEAKFPAAVDDFTQRRDGFPKTPRTLTPIPIGSQSAVIAPAATSPR